MYHRAVKHIERLWDVSIVTTPAYPDTEAQAVQRSMQESKEAYVNSLKEEQENIRKRKLDIELELLNQ